MGAGNYQGLGIKYGGAILKDVSALPQMEPVMFYLAPKSRSISDVSSHFSKKNYSMNNLTDATTVRFCRTVHSRTCYVAVVI